MTEPPEPSESSGATPPSDPPPITAPPYARTTSSTMASGFHAAVPLRHHVEAHPTGRRLGFLSLTALGIVYGDIGTSPLYALRQCFDTKGEYAIPATTTNVYGVLSLVVWLLILVVAVKYIVFIMRADNRGEGGILAQM